MKNLAFRKYCLTIISLILVSIQIKAQNGTWTRKADMPTLRGACCAVVINNKIYVLGGMNSSFINYDVNEVYDPLTNTWDATKQPMHYPRAFLSAATVNDTIYAIGGGMPTTTQTVEAYDTATNFWTFKADMLSLRFGAAAGVVDGIIYNVGGNHYESNCEAYNPTTDEWTPKAPIPETYGGIIVAPYGGLLYAFGGGFDTTFKTTYSYDPVTDEWTKKKDMPTARGWSHTAPVVDGKIYVLGGYKKCYGEVLSVVEVYDPVKDEWTNLPDMPFKRALFATAVVDGKIYILGGTADWGDTGGKEVWEYDPYTEINAGDVSGTWTLANSPYHILGEITIPNDSTLAIEPGVEVVFMGHYKFNVQGRLLAIGTQQDSIHFTADDTQTGWHGVRFINTLEANDTSKFVYCSFKYGKANTGSGWDRCGGAILIGAFNKVFISDCLFEKNENYGDISTTGGAAIYLKYASPIITNCTFRYNQGTTDCSVLCANSYAVISKSVFSNNSGPHGPIFCYYDSSTVSGNIISNNTTTRAGGGIFVMTSHSIITNNIIFSNSCFGGEGEGGGIKCWINDKSIIINNTIAYNSATHGGGICCNQNSDPTLINNIIWGNTATYGNQVNLLEATSDPDFFFCDIQGGKEGFGGNGAGNNYTGQYENNIDSDPAFVDTTSSNFRLTDSSHCIGAGIDSIEVGSTMYYCPPFCFYGGSRPNPVISMPDIGACENNLGSPVDVEQDFTLPTEFALEQNYPNPFNPRTNIKYTIESGQFVSLKVYDILGNEVATLVNEEKPAGLYNVEFNAATLPSGVYFYKLQSGGFIETKKMILLK